MAPTQAPLWLLALALASVATFQLAQSAADVCLSPSTKYLAANSKTVKWGYYDLKAPYVGHVKSGDTITIEVLTHTAGADYAKMIKGDPGVESVYAWLPKQTVTSKPSPQYPDSGPHIVTGPIKVCGAEPGDVVQVEILKLKPRVNPVTKKTYGCNVLAPFGYHYTNGGHLNGKPFTPQDAATITIYEIVKDQKTRTYYGQPIYQYKQPSIIDPSGRSHPIDDQPIGVLTPQVYDVGLSNKKVVYGPGFRTTLAPGQKGVIYTNATLDYSVPLRPHLGIMGVMPANGQKFLQGAPAGTAGANTIPPSRFGGNIDNWRVGKGTTMYYRAELEGAHLVVADTHASQGDGEISGTAIETHFTVTLKVVLLKKAALPQTIKSISFPLGETLTEYFVHGFAYADYLDQLKVPNDIFPAPEHRGGSDLNLAMRGAYLSTLGFLVDAFHLQEAEAIGLMSTAVDFFVTQVVDANWGVHGVVRKALFLKRTKGRKLLEYVGNKDLVEQMHASARLAARRRNSAIAKLWN